MIDTSKTISKLLDEGYAIAIFDAVVTQTATPSQFIPALDVELLHKQLDRAGKWHDVKPWKTAVGLDDAAAADQSREIDLISQTKTPHSHH